MPTTHIIADWLLRDFDASVSNPTSICFSIIVFEGYNSAFMIFLLTFGDGPI